MCILNAACRKAAAEIGRRFAGGIPGPDGDSEVRKEPSSRHGILDTRPAAVRRPGADRATEPARRGRDRVRDLIIEGALTPGTRIHEGQLGAQLGVSRTPLREALKFLASEGLIELVAARGAIVRTFSAKDVRDMLDVLAVLESFAARLACRDASDRDIAEVRRLHDRMVERYAVRDRLEYFKLNQQIHSAFLRLSGNAALEEAHASIQSRLKRIRYIGNEEPPKWARRSPSTTR